MFGVEIVYDENVAIVNMVGANAGSKVGVV
jgi:hypothetical protein